jgi:hypothetical protein
VIQRLRVFLERAGLAPGAAVGYTAIRLIANISTARIAMMPQRKPPRPLLPIEQIAAEPELAAQYRAARASLDRGSAEALRSLIELGRIICAVADDPSRAQESESRLPGAVAADVLANAPGIKRNALNEAMWLVRTFTDKELELTSKTPTAWLALEQHDHYRHHRSTLVAH